MSPKPEKHGWYFVTLFQHVKMKPEYPDRFNEWIFFDGEKWEDYTEYYKDCSIEAIIKGE